MAQSGGGESSKMSAQDHELCMNACRTLMSDDNSKKSHYLFLDPVNVEHFPTYPQIVKRPMDLGTLKKRLESGTAYSSREQFFQDASLCFENAITFHAGNKQTQWILPVAKYMIKIVQREKKNADKKANGGSNGGSSSSKKSGTKKSKNKRKDKDASSSADGEPPVKKQKLKLKFSTVSSVDSAGAGGASDNTKSSSSAVGSTSTTGKSSSTKSTSSKTKVNLKLKLPTQSNKKKNSSSSAGANVSAGGNDKSTESSKKSSSKSSSKPKLKLSLSLGGSKAKNSSKNEKDSSKSLSPATPASGTTPITPKTTSAPSRGKVPPAGAAPQENAASSTASSTTTKKETSKKEASKKENSSTKAATNKIKLNINAGVRGKELPKGVSASQQQQPQVSSTTTTKTTKKSTKSKSDSKKSKKASSAAKSSASSSNVAAAAATSAPQSISSTAAALGITVAPMTSKRRVQCFKVLNGLKRRKAHRDMKWFTSPVTDKAIVGDYRAKIKNPMDLGSMTTKLEKNEYATLGDFCLDLRRIFSNCLRYNTTVDDSFRPLAVDMLTAAEELMGAFIARMEAPNIVYQPLLYCWKLCVSTLTAVINFKNPKDGHQTAHYFMHPVSFYFGGELPADYLQKVKRPIDLGTVTSALLEGQYQKVQEFVNDCLLIKDNCVAYYGGSAEGALFIDLANRLHQLMKVQLDALMRYDQSSASAPTKQQAAALSAFRLSKPPPSFLMGILKEIRGVKYTDKFTKITEPAMAPFEKPVNLTLYQDYQKFVEVPIDLETIESRTKAGLYETPEDFEYDVLLIFRNCEAYNAPRRSDHMVALGKYGAKKFRQLFATRMKQLENPQLVQATSKPQQQLKPGEQNKRSSSPVPSERPSKKVKIEAPKSNGGKTATRISITGVTSVAAASGTGKVARSKSPKNTGGGQKKKSSVSATPKPNEPVPLHVAITQIKARFPIRRQYKILESWEGACARFFRELMKHPWINAARPKFIFHVPVPVLFPELKDSYAAKIQKPMDLTTVEAKLLQGGLYFNAQDFVDEVALVFHNAITFNREGRNLGEPMSCAYYDASIHLLRYTRWLSLEILANYLSDDPFTDEILQDELPPTAWKLTKANRKKAREEMESIVMNERIEKSFEGDRYTSTESECEKLLKALRHQSDLRYMTYFIDTAWPADYAAYIAKPMDWGKVNRTLQKRQYDKIGDVIEDLRLIFSNALKYNARGKGTDTVSGKAYDAAVYMSKKLEVAIDKSMLAVSDRSERERIDHNIAEREIEAAERLEKERLRELWAKEGQQSGNDPNSSTVETIETIRVVNRRQPQRKEILDFEYFDEEDDGTHERSYIEAQRQQKTIYEKQTKARGQMHATARDAGAVVFDRAEKYAQILQIAIKMQKVARGKVPAKNSTTNVDAAIMSNAEQSGSMVLSKLEKKDRAQIRLQPKIVKRKKKRKVVAISLE